VSVRRMHSSCTKGYTMRRRLKRNAWCLKMESFGFSVRAHSWLNGIPIQWCSDQLWQWCWSFCLVA
jgi:hypothetical protein